MQMRPGCGQRRTRPTTALLATAMTTTQKRRRYVVASPFFILFLTLIAPPFHLSLTHTTPRVVQTPARVRQHTQRHANTLRMREGARRRCKHGDSLSLMTGTSPLLSFTLTLTSPQGMNMRRKCGRHVPNDVGQGAMLQRYVHPLSSLSPHFIQRTKQGDDDDNTPASVR